MVKIAAFDPITYLVGRRFPGLNGLEIEVSYMSAGEVNSLVECARQPPATNFEAIQQSLPSGIKSNALMGDYGAKSFQQTIDRQRKAATYRAELLTATKDTIDARVVTERKREAEDLATRQAAEERKRFYHLPGAQGDFSEYSKLAYWTLDEAVALSLAKNPKVVNWKSVCAYTHTSSFAKEYEKRREVISRALWAKQLYDPIYPTIFLAWAKTKFAPLPTELLQAALDDGVSLTGWKDLYEGLVTTSKQNLANQATQNQKHVEAIAQLYKAKLEEVYAELGTARLEVHALKLEAETDNSAPKTEQPLRESERRNLQAMLSLCAIRAYGYDPNKKNSASTDIHNQLASVDYEISVDAIHRQLSAGTALLGPTWREKLKSTPKR